MDYFEEIKKVDWQYLVSRKEESLLFHSLTDHSYKKDFPRVTALPWKATLNLRCGQGELFHSTEELDKLRSIFRKGGINLFLNFRRRLIRHVKNIDNLAHRIKRTDCSKSTQKELLNLLNNYHKAALDAHKFLLPVPVTDGVISKMILEKLPDATEEEKQNWLRILVFSQQENEYLKEEKSFYGLVRAYQDRNKNFNDFLQDHLKRFAVIGTRGYHFDRAWTITDIKERLKNLIAQGKNPEKELMHLTKIQKDRESTAKKLIKKFKIKKSSSLFKLIMIARDFAYLRTWRTDVLYGVGYYACNLFYEIAKRAKFKKTDIFYLTFEELIKMAETTKSPISVQELKRRKEYFASFLSKGRYVVLSGRMWQKRIKKIIDSVIGYDKAVKGSVAFPGRVRGYVKVVFTSKELKKVRQGDILVAVLTFPHFIAAMEKAAAFITDEGGILCHAAIISREMQKPCIIGTKIATKVLKDGDLVEVDANKGIVRILK